MTSLADTHRPARRKTGRLIVTNRREPDGDQRHGTQRETPAVSFDGYRSNLRSVDITRRGRRGHRKLAGEEAGEQGVTESGEGAGLYLQCDDLPNEGIHHFTHQV